MDIVQALIALTGLTAIALTQLPIPAHYVRFAPIVGLIGQPFWLISTYTNNQMGIFTVCCCYVVLWCIGIYRQWIANNFEGFKDFKQKIKRS